MSKQSDDQSMIPEDQDNVDAADQQHVADGDSVSNPMDQRDAARAEDAADSASAATSEQQLNHDLEEAIESVSTRAELEETQQRLLRLQAELENYRKRAQRTLEEERRYACLPLMRDLLPVVDNLNRALEAAQQNEENAGLLEGVKMVADQLISTLKKHHCEEIPTEGTPFDPNLHEAIAQFPSEDHEPGEITQVTQVGYQLHDRVIRPSQVILAAPKPEQQ